MLAHSLRYLWRLRNRLIEVIVLALIATACMAWASQLIGVRHRGLLVMFVVTWLASAAKRLSDFRRGAYSPLKAYGPSGNAIPTLIAGTCPWIVLAFLYKAYPASFLWTSESLPVWLNLIGVALALITLAGPGVRSIKCEPDSSSLVVPPLTVHAQILALAMLLMSGSLVIGLVLSVWLLMLHKTAQRRPSLPSALSLLRMDPEKLRLQTIKST